MADKQKQPVEPATAKVTPIIDKVALYKTTPYLDISCRGYSLKGWILGGHNEGFFKITSPYGKTITERRCPAHRLDEHPERFSDEVAMLDRKRRKREEAADLISGVIDELSKRGLVLKLK